MSAELQKKILKKYLEYTENGKTSGLYFHEMAKILDEDKEKVKAECQFLEDEKYLEREKTDVLGKKVTISVRITSKGREALETIYNPEWVEQNKKAKNEEKKLREREIINAETSHKWTKYGVIVAIILGGISLVVSIFKP